MGTRAKIILTLSECQYLLVCTDSPWRTLLSFLDVPYAVSYFLWMDRGVLICKSSVISSVFFCLFKWDFILCRFHHFHMTRNRVKRRKRPGTRSTDARSALKHELIIASRISRIITVIGMITILPVIVLSSSYNPAALSSGWFVIIFSMVTILVLTTIACIVGTRNRWLISQLHVTHDDLAKYRRGGKILLASFFLIIIVGFIPGLHAKGYILKLTELLPGEGPLGNKLSIVVAFALGATVSGVLGNFAYDGLKWLLRKMTN